MNNTPTNPETESAIEDNYVVTASSVIFCLITAMICSFILYLIWTRKERLHTIHHLLIFNTCIASIIYCTVTIHNCLYLVFGQWDRSDMNCRWRAYFAYVSVAGEMYSYMVQAVSRYFFCVLSMKHRWLITYKCHYILITAQWIIVFLITSSTLLTKDITYTPGQLCLIPLKSKIHPTLAIFAYYVVPLLTSVLIYVHIFYRVKQRKRNATIIVHLHLTQTRDLQLLRNILILITIYLAGGFPTMVHFLTPSRYSYLISLVTIPFAVAVAKLFIILLDRELRSVTKNLLRRRTTIAPVNTVHPIVRFRSVQ